MDFSSRSIRPEGTFHQWGKDAAPEWGRSLGLSSKGEGCKTLLSFLLSIEHLFWSQLQTPERSPCTARLRSQPFLGVLWIFTPGPGWLIPPPSFWFAKIQVVCEYLTITPVWKGVTKSQSQTSRAAALFVVEQADTGTVAVCFPPSGSFFPFTATVLCINDCEEINLLSKEIYETSSYLGLLDLGSISQSFVSAGQGVCAHCCPGTTWNNLVCSEQHLLPFRGVVLVPSELAVLSVSGVCRRCPSSSFSHIFISLGVCVGCWATLISSTHMYHLPDAVSIN